MSTSVVSYGSLLRKMWFVYDQGNLDYIKIGNNIEKNKNLKQGVGLSQGHCLLHMRRNKQLTTYGDKTRIVYL